MNIFNINNEHYTTEEIKKIQMDLEAPLLERNDDDDDDDTADNKKIAEIHSAVPFIDGTELFHVSELCQGLSKVNAKTKKAAAGDCVVNSNDDGNDGDDDDDSATTIIDGRCEIVNGTYLCGFILGLVLQACSLYIVNIVLPANGVSASAEGETTTTAAAAAAAISYHKQALSFPTVFFLYFFTRYWVLVALLLPPVVCAMRNKMRRRRNKSSTGKRKSISATKCLESFFECIRFQFGLFLGSLILLSGVNCYALAKTAPLCILLAYYGICVVVSFFAMCLLQIFCNQVCANVSSVEIIVSYDMDDDDHDHDHDDNNDE